MPNTSIVSCISLMTPSVIISRMWYFWFCCVHGWAMARRWASEIIGEKSVGPTTVKHITCQQTAHLRVARIVAKMCRLAAHRRYRALRNLPATQQSSALPQISPMLRCTWVMRIGTRVLNTCVKFGTETKYREHAIWIIGLHNRTNRTYHCLIGIIPFRQVVKRVAVMRRTIGESIIDCNH